MSSYQQQRETRSRIIFTVLIIAVTYGLIRLTLPSITGQNPTTNNSSNPTAQKQEEKKDLPRGDAKRVADLDRLATALKTYKERHGGYPMSTGTCAGGTFDSDAELGFLADLDETVARRPRGRPRVPKRVRVNFEPRERLDIWKLALVLHGVYARDQARAKARKHEHKEAMNRDDAG